MLGSMAFELTTHRTHCRITLAQEPRHRERLMTFVIWVAGLSDRASIGCDSVGRIAPVSVVMPGDARAISAPGRAPPAVVA